MTPQELKNSILQLAIQGKLVEQCPEEGTAEELYRQIQREKAALVKAGKIKKEKPLPEITEDEVPFEIPETWKWVRVREYCIDVFSGKSPIYSKEKTPYLVIGQAANQQAGLDMEQVKYTVQSFWEAMDQRYFLQPYDVILNTLGNGTLGRSGIITEIHEPLLTDGHLFVFRQLNRIMSLYLYYNMQHKRKEIEKSANGSTNQTFLNLKGTLNWLVPMPPLAEQKRIVAKIEELLPYIERYEKAWSRLEDFNKRFPTDMQKSILQLAIQGKLVPQRPEEGTGEELYRQIQAEKQSLIRSGKLKKEKPLPAISENEIPFDIPESWKWERFLSVVEIATNLVSPVEYQNHMHIAPDNIEKGTGRLLECRTVQQDKVSSANHLFHEGQVLYSKIRPLLRKAVIAPFDGLCSADMYPLDTSMDTKYLLYYLLSDTFNLQIATAMSSRVKMPKINQNELSKVLIPLPPLAEQKRIVAKLEELLPLCDRLKQ